MSSVPRLPVDARLLEPFVVLAEELHFTRAGERLHLAQPALSQQIGRLERQLGTALFTRSPQAVALTPAGVALLARVRPALAELRDAVQEARAVGEGRQGTLRLVHLSSFGPRMVPALADALQVAVPELRLVSRESSVEEQLDALRDGTADVGLFYRDPTLPLGDAGIVLEPIAAGPHYIALTPGHPLAGEAVLDLERLADEWWVMPTGTSTPGYQASFFLTMCARHGFTPRVRQEANSIETMLGLVAAGFGIAPAPWLVVHRRPDDVALVPTAGEEFAIVAAHRGSSLASVAAFVDVSRTVAGELLRGLPAGHARTRSEDAQPVLDGEHGAI